MSSKYASFLKLVKKAHTGQFRNSGSVPYWVHCDRVARLLFFAFAEIPGVQPKLREAVVLAALGHDLYEDTIIAPAVVIKQYGQTVHNLIMEVTNTGGDQKVTTYAQHLRLVSEEALLIKLADLYDNYMGAAYGIHELDRTWVNTFLWPTLEKQWRVVDKRKFVKYNSSASLLKKFVALARTQLHDSINRLNK